MIYSADVYISIYMLKYLFSMNSFITEAKKHNMHYFKCKCNSKLMRMRIKIGDPIET